MEALTFFGLGAATKYGASLRRLLHRKTMSWGGTQLMALDLL
jgi:hypothetical protein